MGNLKLIGIAVFSILILMMAGVSFAKKEITTKSELFIISKKEVPFMLINDLTQWKKWNPWLSDSSQLVYSDVPIGEKAYYNWDFGKQKGKVLIKSSTDNELIVEFYTNSILTSSNTWQFNENIEGTTVSWEITAYLDNPIQSFFIGNLLERDTKKGLENIKTIAEK